MAITPEDKKNRDDSSIFEEEKEEEKETPKSSNLQKIVIQAVIVCAVLVGLISIAVYASSGKKEEGTSPVETEVGGESYESQLGGKPWLSGDSTPRSPSPPANTEEIEEEEDGRVSAPDGIITPGIKDISGDTYDTNYTDVGEDTFVKDLNGLDVKENYEIESIYTTVDFISYEKNRAVTDEGIEIYWLDATYKGKKAKVQVPFRIFKELDPEGVTVVDVEVVRTRNENREISEIVTGFVVRSDYKKILEQNSRR